MPPNHDHSVGPLYPDGLWPSVVCRDKVTGRLIFIFPYQAPQFLSPRACKRLARDIIALPEDKPCRPQ